VVKKLGILIALAAVALMSSASAVHASGGDQKEGKLVRIRGENRLIPNQLIASTFRFDPGQIGVSSGGSVTWADRDQDPDDPHTATVVRREDLPRTVDEVFACQEDPNAPCAQALAAHFGTDPPTLRVNVGRPGFNRPGDSVLILPDQSISARITAPEKSKLYYLCAIHPWMQGSITVR
jgi:plastocyanin